MPNNAGHAIQTFYLVGGWQGRIADSRSPSGGGGPGCFRSPNSMGSEQDLISTALHVHPASPINSSGTTALTSGPARVPVGFGAAQQTSQGVSSDQTDVLRLTVDNLFSGLDTEPGKISLDLLKSAVLNVLTDVVTTTLRWIPKGAQQAARNDLKNLLVTQLTKKNIAEIAGQYGAAFAVEEIVDRLAQPMSEKAGSAVRNYTGSAWIGSFVQNSIYLLVTNETQALVDVYTQKNLITPIIDVAATDLEAIGEAAFGLVQDLKGLAQSMRRAELLINQLLDTAFLAAKARDILRTKRLQKAASDLRESLDNLKKAHPVLMFLIELGEGASSIAHSAASLARSIF